MKIRKGRTCAHEVDIERQSQTNDMLQIPIEVVGLGVLLLPLVEPLVGVVDLAIGVGGLSLNQRTSQCECVVAKCKPIPCNGITYMVF